MVPRLMREQAMDNRALRRRYERRLAVCGQPISVTVYLIAGANAKERSCRYGN
jgi:hypothetical protein